MITSAPMSARYCAPAGPCRKWQKLTIFMPLSSIFAPSGLLRTALRNRFLEITSLCQVTYAQKSKKTGAKLRKMSYQKTVSQGSGGSRHGQRGRRKAHRRRQIGGVFAGHRFPRP
ncbi:hypothetical protein BQ8794_320082 [Mesorhizobium prunaredense]|uniref:Uncharacterized protein n=1 Tax=Mesorhizobium prunaredense TaxID=1631249 RepID=A0A1R3VBH2_9HYPH|nr:hypothetical protein BQ8794_320082 [Mesorhizobium prunaredense]